MPRDITVTFGDGSTHVYKGAPDDVTPDAVQARAEKEFGKSVSALDGGRSAPVTQSRGTVPVEPPSVGGFLSNVGTSAGKYLGGLVEAVASPVKTAGTLLDIAAGGVQKVLPKGVVDFVNSLDTPEGQAAAKRAADTASAVGGMYAQRYGSLEGIKKAAYEDPVGVAGDLSALLSMGAGAVRAAPAATQAGFKVARAVPAFQGQAALTTMPQQIAAVAQPTANMLEAAARYTNPLQPVSSGLSAIGKAMKGAPQTPQVQEAITAAREAGYVIPPSQARDSAINKLIEGTAGKSTGQAASIKNQAITNRLANETIGLAPDVQLTPAVLDSVRAEAGKAYQAVSKLGDFDVTGGAKLPAEVNVRSVLDPYVMTYNNKVDAGELVRAWKQANADATAYYRAYGRDANPETLAKAKQAADSAKQIDSFLNDQLKSAGMTDLLGDLKAARVQIAKTYSIEDALNPVTGNVDAKKLATRIEKGKPLSGGLETAGRFASQFKKAARTPEEIGSIPGISPLDVFAASGLSAATGSPVGMVAAYGRPLARNLALSNLIQNRLVQTSSGAPPLTAQQINYFNALLQSQPQGSQ